MSKEGTVTLTNDQFKQLLEAARGGPAKINPDLGANDTFEAMIEQIKYQKPIKQENVECVNRETGSEFVAEVMPSRQFPQGRVVRIRDYKHPDGVDARQKDGGLVPDGYVIGSNEHREWKKDRYFKADLQRWVGGPLPAFIRKNITAEELAAALVAPAPRGAGTVGAPGIGNEDRKIQLPGGVEATVKGVGAAPGDS